MTAGGPIAVWAEPGRLDRKLPVRADLPVLVPLTLPAVDGYERVSTAMTCQVRQWVGRELDAPLAEVALLSDRSDGLGRQLRFLVAYRGVVAVRITECGFVLATWIGGWTTARIGPGAQIIRHDD